MVQISRNELKLQSSNIDQMHLPYKYIRTTVYRIIYAITKLAIQLNLKEELYKLCCLHSYVHAKQDTFPYCTYIVSTLPSAHQTNITFRSNSWGVGRGFFVLAVRTLLACSTCGSRGDGRRTTLPLVRVPPPRGCSIRINPKGVDGLRGPPGRNSRAASQCVSCLLIQRILHNTQMHYGDTPYK